MTIAPTVDLEQAAGHAWDVIVVGAGPAGALAARELARRGMAVLLVDRASFPRFKVCGACLNLRALGTLTAVGLGGLTSRLGALPLAGFRLAVGGRQAWVPLPGGVALSREAFDAALVEAAIHAGAAFLPRTRAGLGPVSSTAREVRLHQDHRETAAASRLVLAADGLGGRLLLPEATCRTAAGSRLGAGVLADGGPEVFSPGTIFMACGTGGYVGLVRIEGERLNLAAAFDPAFIKQAGGPGPAAVFVLGEAGFPPVPSLAGLPWRGTPLLTRRLLRPAAERVFVLGDAAGYVEPFTGEGMAWALAAGVAVTPLAVRACGRWDPALAGRWSVRYRRAVRCRQWTCRVVAGVVRRPALLRLAVAAIARAPVLASPVVCYLNRS